MERFAKLISDRTAQRITLSRHSGEHREFLIRHCDEEDLGEIMELQQKIYDELYDPGIYAKVDEEEILESLKEDYCLGVYYEPDGTAKAGPADTTGTQGTPQLVAFTMMINNRISHRNYGTYVGYSPQEQLTCVSMEITIVDEPCRGFGMQRLFVHLREATAMEMGATQAMVTIGPENTYSLHNLMKEGYEIIDTRPMYEGAMRHILRKEL